MNQKFGLKLNWDMRIFTNDTNPADSPNEFAPTGFDYEQWLDTAVSVGAEYVVIQAKHHRGFAMWPTQYAVNGFAPYSIAESDWYANNGQIDIVGTLVSEARARGLKPVIYFSIWDRNHELRTGTDQTTDAPAYIDMVKAQLTELLTNYGEIYAVWFDGWEWHIGYENIPYATIHDYVKSISPNTLVIENSHNHPTLTSEVELYEKAIDGSIPNGNTRPSEEVDTIRNDGKWCYWSADDQTGDALRTAEQINAAIANAVNNNATYLLAITPDTAGEIPAAQLTLLGDVVVPE